ncbi:MAG: TIGR03790 family protein [Lentisphaerae bacterium]|nr:TIGR03790 family protein [Lentisphaerota bacterium]
MALAVPAWALGPHEVLLLINEQSSDSIAVGKEYAALRRIPSRNIVRLAIPAALLKAPSISAADFERRIWNPASQAVRERGLESQILVWLYSVDFPVRIATKPEISVLGLTFLRNRVPDPDLVENGTYVSPLFGGAGGIGQAAYLAQSFDVIAEGLGADMPLPAMMLGYTRPPYGNSLEKVQACLRKGVASDSTFPSGTVYFVQTSDIRSTSRAWQQRDISQQLARLGVRAVITNAEPVSVRDVLGLQMGAPDVRPERNRYLPGAMAEHLTSAGGVLVPSPQTKLTAWIEAGATASAGTVTEPYAIWAKFPSAQFFIYYASGCTLIESLYESIRCPLQLLLIGEPLASPWKPKGRLLLSGVDGPLRDARVVRPRVESAYGFDYRHFRYYVDGRFMHDGDSWTVDESALAPGAHRLRVVGYGTGLVRQQVFEECELVAAPPEGRTNVVAGTGE